MKVKEKVKQVVDKTLDRRTAHRCEAFSSSAIMMFCNVTLGVQRPVHCLRCMVTCRCYEILGIRDQVPLISLFWGLGFKD